MLLCDKSNAKNYIDSLAGVRGEYGRFVTFLGSTSCRKSKRLKTFLKEMDEKNRTCCFPPYAPELSPVAVRRSVNAMLRGKRRLQS